MSPAEQASVMPDVPECPVIDSFAAADQALLQLGQLESLLTKFEASLNTKIQKLRDEYELNTRTSVDLKEQIVIGLQEFCLQNEAEFTEPKTRVLTHGTIGFRKTPPKLLMLKKFTAKIILDLFRKNKKFTGFIRTKQEIDKEAIHTAYAAKELSDKALADVGIVIDQKDEFTYDIKWESITS
jgi:phage host-nuclease inhibitor protein Gam